MLTDEEFAFKVLQGFSVGHDFELYDLLSRDYIAQTGMYSYTVLKSFNLTNGGSFQKGSGFVW